MIILAICLDAQSMCDCGACGNGRTRPSTNLISLEGIAHIPYSSKVHGRAMAEVLQDPKHFHWPIDLDSVGNRSQNRSVATNLPHSRRSNDTLLQSLDQRFAAVRTLDLLPDESALVMEKANASALNWQMLTASQFTRRRADLESLARVFQNAGAWLRQFHELPSLSHTGERGTTREEFIESIDLFTDYLSDGKPDPWNHIRDVITAAATDQLPKILPMGLNHGDYAPRNVLTEPSGRISIIDTIARWRAPIYEDLAHFINAIKISHPQVWTFGLAYKKPDLEMFETRFLNGYFGDTAVPRVQVRLFECQMLLERWAAITFRSRVATGWKRVAKETRRIVWESFLKRQLFKNMQYFQQCSNQPQGAI